MGERRCTLSNEVGGTRWLSGTLLAVELGEAHAFD